MSCPKISIITITFNSERTVEETLISVTSQNYENLEYLIIDGGSRDGTLEIVNKYRENIDYIVSEPDKGIGDAFNKGIKAATGEIVGIINSDDILLPGALQMIADAYDSSIDIYSGNVIFWDDTTNKTVVTKPTIKFDKIKLQYGVAHPSRFIRRDAYNRFGDYDIRFRYNMDAELLCRHFRAGAKFMHIDECLTKFRMGATTADPIYKKKEDYRLFVKSMGGSSFTFKRIWMTAIVKYNVIQLSYKLFGSDVRYKIGNNKFLKNTILRVFNYFFN